ncbi:hypothetical protein HNQ02_003154 [Flavobacterium sp. 7E]|uniref:hypothetical protein n=1 Tax=unclassified Flavobacterium TaxID=196869 RepID=UPI00156DC909|nr:MULTISPECIES: hypothetical protein [unclassified Flavobacterium]MBE0392211.1 hypothetical protein [Flavobacterium sp. PL002]NRS90217.1 hypothetical protein [Flavobacterium sp. 7E]
MEIIDLNKTVGKSIQEFYDKNVFGEDGGINKKFAWIKFGFISIPLPNFESRKKNVYLHDIHHIITDNNISWKGESAVSAWEIASGGWGNFVIPWLLTLWAMGLGVLFHRKSTLKAFTNGRTMRNALTCGLTKSEICNLTVAAIRAKVSNQNNTNKSFLLWSTISLIIFFLPFVLGGIVLIEIINLF